MKNSTLKNYLASGLTLAGYEDGQYQWIGKREDWERFDNFEMGDDLESKQNSNGR